jgi:hypothetical protein
MAPWQWLAAKRHLNHCAPTPRGRWWILNEQELPEVPSIRVRCSLSVKRTSTKEAKHNNHMHTHSKHTHTLSPHISKGRTHPPTPTHSHRPSGSAPEEERINTAPTRRVCNMRSESLYVHSWGMASLRFPQPNTSAHSSPLAHSPARQAERNTRQKKKAAHSLTHGHTMEKRLPIDSGRKVVSAQ